LTETGPTTIFSIHTTKRQGANSPLTTSGDLLVNGAFVSSYVSLSWLKGHVSGEMLHYFQHGALFPVRLISYWVGNEKESYGKVTGYSTSVQLWFRFEQWQLSLEPAAQVTILLILLIPALLTYFFGRRGAKKSRKTTTATAMAQY